LGLGSCKTTACAAFSIHCTEYNMCDGSSAQSDRVACAVCSEELFEFVVGDKGGSRAVEIEAEAGKDLLLVRS
jgi:hypothetical protein